MKRTFLIISCLCLHVLMVAQKNKVDSLTALIQSVNGIQASIKEKIFNPSLQLTPTGQGTGLGLSLAYDIIKAHEGELKVETKEGGRM